MRQPERSFPVIAFVTAFLALGGCADKPLRDTPDAEGELSLIVNVENLYCCEGILRVGVYSDAARWMRNDGLIRGRVSMITSPGQQVEIHGLAEGTYAIAVHQDINGDGKLNRRLWLFPREPYGFSNDVGKFGPASFEKASFPLKGDKELTIRLHEVPGHPASAAE